MATGHMWLELSQRKMNGNHPIVLLIIFMANTIPAYRLVGVAPDAQILSFKVFSDVRSYMLSYA